ncbi:Diaphanous [Balamuthia mandrillaris]
MSSEGTSPRGDRKHSSKRKSGSGGGTVAGKTTTHHHRKKAHSKEKDRESLPKGERSAVVPPSSPSASSLSSSGHHHHRGGRRRTHRSHAAASTSSETEPLDAELPYWGKLVSFCSEAHPDVELSLPKELLGRGPQCHPASRYTVQATNGLAENSSNGTYVNGSLVGKGKVIRLRTSDEITFVVPNIYDEDYSPTESIAYTYLDFFEQWRGAAPSVPSSPAAASSSSSPAPVLVLPALPKKQKEKGKEDGEHEDSEQQDFLSSYRVSPRQPQRHQPEEQKQRAGFDPAKVGGVSLLAPSSPSPSVARRKEGQSAEAPSPASARTTSPATPQAKESGGASGQAEKTQPFDHLLTAEQFMRELQVNCEADLLAALNERLRTCEESWLISFLDITGMDLLLDVLSHSDRKSKLPAALEEKKKGSRQKRNLPKPFALLPACLPRSGGELFETEIILTKGQKNKEGKERVVFGPASARRSKSEPTLFCFSHLATLHNAQPSASTAAQPLLPSFHSSAPSPSLLLIAREGRFCYFYRKITKAEKGSCSSLLLWRSHQQRGDSSSSSSSSSSFTPPQLHSLSPLLLILSSPLTSSFVILSSSSFPSSSWPLIEAKTSCSSSISSLPPPSSSSSSFVFLRTPSDEQIEWECIRCVETVLNTELGFELIFEVPQLLEDLALFLDSSNVQVRAKIPQIFAAICLYSPEAHELILRSMTFFKEAKKEKARFERLVRSLTDPGNSVQYKVHCMCLINHMIDGVTEVEHRVELREEFVRLGLLDLMRPLRMHRSKELDSQLDHFLAQAEKDNAESSVHDTDLSDPIEMTTQIKAIMIGTSGYPYFLGTLQNLLLIAARGSDKSVWEKVEQSTHDAVMTEEEATGETRLNLAKLKEAIQAKQQQKEESADKELNKRELMRKQFEEEQLAFKEKMRQEMDAVQQKHRTEKEEMELSFKLEIAELKKELSSLQTKLMEANNRNGSFQTTSSSSITTRTISSATNNGDKDLKQEENLSASPPPPGGAPPPPPGMPPPPPSGSGGPPPPPFGAPTMMMEADDPNQPRPSVPVKQLYWVKIPPVKKEQTIWQHIDHHNVEVETSTLEELFKLKQRHHDRDDENAGSSDAATDTDSKPSEEEGAKTSFTAVQKVKKKRTLIDPKRANNIAVMLAHFRLPLDSIRKSILELNMDVLTEHNVHQLLNYAPTEEEEQILAEFKDSPQEVGRVEQFFLQMLTIPRFKQRMATFAFKLNFKNHLEELEYDIDVICNATTELRNSPKFSKTLEVILAIGNFMNAGPRKPSAAGFKLSFLTKLGDTKSTDNKATMIHYLASLFHRNYPELLTTHTELKSVEEATKISADTILAEIKTMTSELAKLEEELALEYPPEDRYKEVMSHFHAEAVHHIQRILHKKDQMESAYRATLQFFGEEATMQSEDFFAQIHDFLLALEKAAKDNAREKVLAEKKQVMEAKKKEREEQKAKQGQMKARIKAKASVRQRGGGEERPTSIRKGVLDNLYGSMRKGAICREERQEE